MYEFVKKILVYKIQNKIVLEEKLPRKKLTLEMLSNTL